MRAANFSRSGIFIQFSSVLVGVFHFYGGVDLHARRMHVCIVDQEGQTQVHKDSIARKTLVAYLSYVRAPAVNPETLAAVLLGKTSIFSLRSSTI